MKLNILTHPVHPSWEYEFCKLGHNVFSIIPQNFNFIDSSNWKKDKDVIFQDVWNINQRPLPSNLHFISLRQAQNLISKGFFHLLLIHTLKWLEFLKKFIYQLPVILHFHTLTQDEFFLPEWADKANIILTFNSHLAKMKVKSKYASKFVIPVPVDFNFFNGYQGDILRCLTVNNLIPFRQEKNKELILKLANQLPLDVIGAYSEKLQFNTKVIGLGEAFGRDELLFFYRHWAVYCDVNDHLSLSLIEAMAVGMPVVLLARNEIQPGYKGEFFKDNENCLIAYDIDDMVKKSKRLLKDEYFRRKIGQEARQTAQRIYDAENFRLKWQKLFFKLKLVNKKWT